MNTTEAAKRAGITRQTLQDWLRRGWIVGPIVQVRDGHSIRVWSMRDVKALQTYAKKHLRVRGRKKAKR